MGFFHSACSWFSSCLNSPGNAVWGGEVGMAERDWGWFLSQGTWNHGTPDWFGLERSLKPVQSHLLHGQGHFPYPSLLQAPSNLSLLMGHPSKPSLLFEEILDENSKFSQHESDFGGFLLNYCYSILQLLFPSGWDLSTLSLHPLPTS